MAQAQVSVEREERPLRASCPKCRGFLLAVVSGQATLSCRCTRCSRDLEVTVSGSTVTVRLVADR